MEESTNRQQASLFPLISGTDFPFVTYVDCIFYYYFFYIFWNTDIFFTFSSINIETVYIPAERCTVYVKNKVFEEIKKAVLSSKVNHMGGGRGGRPRF